MNSKRIELLNLNNLVKMLNISRSTIYRKIKPNAKQYDPTFPKPIKVGQKAIRWRLSDVEKWLDEQVHLTTTKPC
ncbi:MAG: helix-turn-helix transcriptional regulator [Hydrogenovibrio sp.]